MTSGPPLCGLRHWSVFKELLVSLVVQSRAQLGTWGHKADLLPTRSMTGKSCIFSCLISNQPWEAASGCPFKETDTRQTVSQSGQPSGHQNLNPGRPLQQVL